MRKYVKWFFLIFKSILIFIVIGAVSTACVKNVYKEILIEQFKKKGIYQPDISTDNIKYYKIESNETYPVFIKNGDDVIPGNTGDILVSTQAFLAGPFINGFVGFFAGGHAAFCMGNYSDFDFSANETTSLEATGMEEDSNLSNLWEREYWAEYQNPFTEIIGLRVSMTDKERKEVVSAATSLLGDPYNYSFLFDTTNKSYCSDLVAKAFKKIGKNLNKDDFTTSIYDLIVSKDSYISYYHYFDSNGIKYIYYLG